MKKLNISKKEIIFEDMKCDYCEAEAVVNYQKAWERFKISKGGFYKEDRLFNAMDIEEPINDNNVHLCDKHEEPWLEGKI